MYTLFGHAFAVLWWCISWVCTRGRNNTPFVESCLVLKEENSKTNVDNPEVLASSCVSHWTKTFLTSWPWTKMEWVPKIEWGWRIGCWSLNYVGNGACWEAVLPINSWVLKRGTYYGFWRSLGGYDNTARALSILESNMGRRIGVWKGRLATVDCRWWRRHRNVLNWFGYASMSGPWVNSPWVW